MEQGAYVCCKVFIVVPVIVISATVINWLLLTDKDEKKMRIKQMIAGLRKNIFNKRPTF